jgi:hypothetical protein
MVSSAIWIKHARLSFSKTPNSTRPSDAILMLFEKLTPHACFVQIALETILPILKPFTMHILHITSCETGRVHVGFSTKTKQS